MQQFTYTFKATPTIDWNALYDLGCFVRFDAAGTVSIAGDTGALRRARALIDQSDNPENFKAVYDEQPSEGSEQGASDRSTDKGTGIENPPTTGGSIPPGTVAAGSGTLGQPDSAPTGGTSRQAGHAAARPAKAGQLQGHPARLAEGEKAAGTRAQNK